MTFEDYIPIWYQNHTMARFMDEHPERLFDKSFHDLDTRVQQKLDWLYYCKEYAVATDDSHSEKKDTPEQPDQNFYDNLFEEIMQLFTVEAYDREHTIRYGFFADFFTMVPRAKAEEYDIKLLEHVNGLLKRNMPFADKYKLFASWARHRAYFLIKAQLGFPAPEAGWMPAFYSMYRNDFLKIRNTDFVAMKDFANYFLFMYDSCKTMDRQMMAGDIVKVHDFLVGFMRDVLASARANGFDEYEEQIKKIIENLKDETDQVPSVFISYCWADAEAVDKIESEIQSLAHVHRDTHDVESGDSLRVFMNTIRKQDFVILVISDAYLERRNCMYEVLQLLKDYEEGENDFWDKVVPFVTANGIYDGQGIAKKIRYWTEACDDLEKAIADIPSPATETLVKEARVLRYISMEIDKLLDHISDEMCDRDIDVFIQKTKEKLEKCARYGENPIKDVILATLQTSSIEVERTT